MMFIIERDMECTAIRRLGRWYNRFFFRGKPTIFMKREPRCPKK